MNDLIAALIRVIDKNQMMAARLVELHRVLKTTGNLRFFHNLNIPGNNR